MKNDLFMSLWLLLHGYFLGDFIAHSYIKATENECSHFLYFDLMYFLGYHSII